MGSHQVWAWAAQVKHKDKAGGSQTTVTVATATMLGEIDKAELASADDV